MKIVTIGRGNVGGGLAALWRKAGHEVTVLGHDGGDASDADVVLVAVPGPAVSAALGYDPVRVGGLDKARALEDLSWLLFAAAPEGAPFSYRFAAPR